jgi:hypothetical protein
MPPSSRRRSSVRSWAGAPLGDFPRVRSVLRDGFVEEVPAPTDDPAYVWRDAGDGTNLMLRATGQGLAEIGDMAHAPAITGNERQLPTTTLLSDRTTGPTTPPVMPGMSPLGPIPDRPPDPLGRRRHRQVGGAQRHQRIQDRVHDGRCRGDRAPSAGPFRAQWICRTGHRTEIDADRR